MRHTYNSNVSIEPKLLEADFGMACESGEKRASRVTRPRQTRASRATACVLSSSAGVTRAKDNKKAKCEPGSRAEDSVPAPNISMILNFLYSIRNT
ncbi:hypothetical protein EVAR_82117_1 [Eumeta japonica]|uniref:Uncharacterized protein n=1 Tax=Eumeta variegata TaxID=151549 RepID=A0A4C1U2F9_EUMVA|nr:hypothetical protein EVAR_82117_1 [Eumeta japonica]